MRSLQLNKKPTPMLNNHLRLFTTWGAVCLSFVAILPVRVAIAQTTVTINQPGSPAVLIDGNKLMDAKPASATKPRKPAAPAPADSYTSCGAVPQSSTEETHLSNGLVCTTEKGQRTCR
jgi:hypothetical protein